MRVTVEFRLLGDVEARLDGRRLDIGHARQRCVLVALLVDVNRPVPAEQLIDRVWADEPPARARNALAGYISRLRTLLSDTDVVVGREPGGYVLTADPLSIDLHQLRSLASEARATDDVADATALFERALKLWRGEPFAFLDTPWVNDLRTALEAERMSVQLDRNDAALAAGRHSELLGELARALQDDTHDERLAGQLMLAQYRCGRQADALETYRQMRERLVEELGVDPSPPLQRVHQQILDGEAALPVATPSPRAAEIHTGPHADTTSPAALTKYRPPTGARQLVVRTRLIDTLRAGGRRRLFVIHGSAGFGKTTLAAQWREALIADDVTVAWLTIDDDDNNVVSFLLHLIDALRTVRPTLGQESRHALEERGADAERYALTSLINEIDQSDTRIAVVIDDWHRASDAATIAALTYLLDHGSHHLQVVVTSRTRAGLPFGRMRVRDELVEIDAAALRFDVSESHAFLVELGGLPLDKTDVANLEQTTDGWIAALQLASLTLRDCDEPAAMIGRMSGRHHLLGEYLAENVLDSLQPEILDFLMATSLTERISGELASALAGVPHGQALLEEVEDRNLFLRRLDEDREWFRYHHLFAQYLQRRLQRDQPERIKPLHATASRWFADHQMMREAVHHAVAAGEDERAIELIELHGTDLMQHTQMSAFQVLISNLPQRLAALSPRLQLTIGWATSLLQPPAGALAALDAFESAATRRSLPAQVLQDMRVEADVLRAVILGWADRPGGLDELVAECLTRPDTLPPFLVGTAANVVSALDLYRFDFEAVRRRQEWASLYNQQTPVPWGSIYGHCLAGMAANEQLVAAEAEHRFREALRIAEQSGVRHTHAARFACALLGELLYERGDLDEAERLLDESIHLGSEGPQVDFMIIGYVVVARIKAMRGNIDVAASRLDEGARTAARLGLPRLRVYVENERMRLGIPATNSPEALDQEEALTDGGIAEMTAQLRDEAEIRGLLADQPALACERAQAWVERLERQRRPRALLQANRLLVAALGAAGQTDEAKKVLAHVAAQCAELGMVRYLFDGGPQVVALLTDLIDDLQSGRSMPTWPSIPAAFVDRIRVEAQSVGTVAQR